MLLLLNTIVDTMKYKELLQHLQQLNEDQLNMDVVLKDKFGDVNEYYQLYIEFEYAPYDCEIFGLDQPIISYFSFRPTCY